VSGVRVCAERLPPRYLSLHLASSVLGPDMAPCEMGLVEARTSARLEGASYVEKPAATSLPA